MEKISIAFCFDKNLWKQATVSMISLLKASNSKCHYDIYAIISDDIKKIEKDKISKIVLKNDNQSKIKFLNAKDIKKKLNCPAGYYFRLQIPNLIKNLDKIIYCDIDTIFMKDLVSLWNFKIGKNFIAGVKDGLNLNRPWKRYQNKSTPKKYIIEKGKYVNSGVLLLNLKEIRKNNLYKKFIDLIDKNFYQKDQDILNYCCYPKISYLPLKYNFTPRSKFKYYKMMLQGLLLKDDIKHAKNNPIIYHYINCNPWNVYSKKFWYWWKYAKLTPFYKKFKKEFLKKNIFFNRFIFKILESIIE